MSKLMDMFKGVDSETKNKYFRMISDGIAELRKKTQNPGREEIEELDLRVQKELGIRAVEVSYADGSYGYVAFSRA